MRPLPLTDPRAVHLLTILQRAPGESFDAGLINGPRGKGQVVRQDEQGLRLKFAWGNDPPPADPITLILGLPRPQTARDVLRDVTTLGVSAIHFVQTERSDPAYAQSTLWSSGEWQRHLVTGAAQAFDTRLPAISFDQTLAEALAKIPPASTRLALDNYEAAVPLSQAPVSSAAAIVVAIGPERGWTTRDRDELRAAGFLLAHLGPRVLRTEAACIVAIAVLKAQRGLF